MCGFAVVSMPPREVAFSLWFAWTALRTLCRAVWGDPAKPPPSPWLSRLQAACSLMSSSPSANQSTDLPVLPLRPASDTAFRAIPRLFTQSTVCTDCHLPTRRFLLLSWNQRSFPTALPAQPPTFVPTCLTSSPASTQTTYVYAPGRVCLPWSPKQVKLPPHSTPVLSRAASRSVPSTPFVFLTPDDPSGTGPRATPSTGLPSSEHTSSVHVFTSAARSPKSHCC